MHSLLVYLGPITLYRLGMRELPKGQRNVKAHIFSMIWEADPENSRIAQTAVRRILNSFGDRTDGRELADGLINIVDYYALLGYWRGYRDAKRHYQTTRRRRNVSKDREKAKSIVLQVLSRDQDASTQKICRALDRAGVSAWFGGEKYFGPRAGRRQTKRGENWSEGHSEQAVMQWIYRIRKRLKTEQRANAWLERSRAVRPAE